jgi:hypothetical protein
MGLSSVQRIWKARAPELARAVRDERTSPFTVMVCSEFRSVPLGSRVLAGFEGHWLDLKSGVAGIGGSVNLCIIARTYTSGPMLNCRASSISTVSPLLGAPQSPDRSAPMLEPARSSPCPPTGRAPSQLTALVFWRGRRRPHSIFYFAVSHREDAMPDWILFAIGSVTVIASLGVVCMIICTL